MDSSFNKVYQHCNFKQVISQVSKHVTLGKKKLLQQHFVLSLSVLLH